MSGDKCRASASPGELPPPGVLSHWAWQAPLQGRQLPGQARPAEALPPGKARRSCLDTLGYPSDSRRRAGGFEISLLFCSGRLRRRRSNAAWCLGGGSRAFGVAGSAAWATILTVCYCGAAVLICVMSVNLTASVVADRLAARGRSRQVAG